MCLFISKEFTSKIILKVRQMKKRNMHESECNENDNNNKTDK